MPLMCTFQKEISVRILCLWLPALFTKPPASRFPVIPWFDWYNSVKPWKGEQYLRVLPVGSIFLPFCREWLVTKESAALWIALYLATGHSKKAKGWNHNQMVFQPAAPIQAYGTFFSGTVELYQSNYGTAGNREGGDFVNSAVSLLHFERQKMRNSRERVGDWNFRFLTIPYLPGLWRGEAGPGNRSRRSV